MDNLEDIIKNSTFEVIDGIFIYAKVKGWPVTGDHFMVSKDNDEVTVVTKIENLDKINLIERNKEDYCLIALNVSIPFYSVGFLAKVSSTIAEDGMNILIVSTYSKDYIMIKKDVTDKVINILLKLGFKQK